MLNKIKHTAKTWNNKFIKAITIVGATLLITLNVNANPTSKSVQKEIKEVLKKNPDKEIVVKMDSKKAEEKVAKFEMMPSDTINALDFAVQNVDQYYPDMKEHLNTMVNSFRDDEHKEATNKLLNEMIVNIEDPKIKTGLIIGVLEFSIFYKSTFGDIYGDTFSNDIFWFIEKFDTDYKTRFKWYYERLEEKTEQLKKEIIIKQQKLQESQEELEKGRQELEAVMLKFSPEDVKNNTQIKNLVLQTEQRFKDNNFIPSTKVQELFDATK